MDDPTIQNLTDRPMAICQGRQDLLKENPDDGFGNLLPPAFRLCDDSRKITEAAVFHDNIQNVVFHVMITVMISDYVGVTEAFQPSTLAGGRRGIV